MSTASRLMGLYEAMHASLGPSHWWPGDTPFEVAVGAILTQNTNWQNVDKAINAMKKTGVLSPQSIRDMACEELEQLIRPAGYFRMKTKKLKNLVAFLEQEADMAIENLKNRELYELRPLILSINGVGPETADCILNYSLEKPIMVVDAYTKRMMVRHGLVHEDSEYHELQALFMDNLENSAQLFNEFHALIVRTGKDWCNKTNPKCASCPLAFDLE